MITLLPESARFSRALAATTFALLVGLLPQTSSALDLVPLVRKAKPAVVQLLVYDNSGNQVHPIQKRRR